MSIRVKTALLILTIAFITGVSGSVVGWKIAVAVSFSESPTRDACLSYDIDEVEKAMSELESYNYESQQDLVLWVHDQAALFQFDEIVKKLV